MSKLGLIIITILLSLSYTYSQSFWEKTQGPMGGVVKDLKMCNTVLLAGTDRNVIYSTDQGTNWIQTSDYPDSQTYSLSVLLVGTDTLLAGTMQGFYRSTDLGKSWEKEPDYTYGAFNKIKYDSISKKVYLIDAYDIYESADYGKNWDKINGDLPHLQIFNLEIISRGSLIVQVEQYGFFKSTNSGINWTTCNNGLPTHFFNVSIKSSPSGKLFATVYAQLFSSLDNGDNWNFIADSISGYLIDVENDSLLYLKSSHELLKRSTNGGLTWDTLFFNINNINDGISGFVYLSNGRVIVALTFSGMFKTEDNGYSWKQIGVNNSYIQDITSNKSGELFVRTFRAIYHSSDNGNTWNIYGTIQNPVMGYFMCSSDPNKLFMLDSNKVKCSLDGGNNWFYSVPNQFGFECHGLTMTNKGTLLVWGYQLISFRSTDDGTSWESISGLLVGDGGRGVSKNNMICVPKTDRVIVSLDDGKNWSAHNIFAYPVWLRSLDIKSNGEIYFGTFVGLYKSIDSAKTLFPLNPNFNHPINAIKIVGDSLIYCLTDEGFYLCDDEGQNWVRLSDAKNPFRITDFILNNDGYFYAATENGGVLRSIDQITSLKCDDNILTNSFNLYQNYPNPFNPTTQIEYYLPKDQKVCITVYDILGNEVKTLIDGFQSAGNHSLLFNGSELASGLYFYRIVAGNFIQVKKMVLLK